MGVWSGRGVWVGEGVAVVVGSGDGVGDVTVGVAGLGEAASSMGEARVQAVSERKRVTVITIRLADFDIATPSVTGLVGERGHDKGGA